MIRKIIRQGHNTLTITLPSEWVKRFNLSGGEEINVSERDNGLFITSEKKFESKKAEIDIGGMDIPTIWKYFMGVYREGYEEVKVNFPKGIKIESPYKFFTHYKLDKKYGRQREKETYLEFFHELVNRFIGFEIVDYGDDYVVIKDMSEPTSREFDSSLRRVFLLVQQMIEETCKALETANPDGLSHIHDVDINLDKFNDYCIRIMNRIGNKEPNKTALLFSTLCILELIGDEFKNISHHLIHDRKKIGFKNLLGLALSTKEQIDSFYSLFYKFNRDSADRIAEIDARDYMNIQEIYSHAKTEEDREIFHHLRMISRYINALLEIRIEMEF